MPTCKPRLHLRDHVLDAFALAAVATFAYGVLLALADAAARGWL